MMRKPHYAGQFYPKNAEEIKAFISRLPKKKFDSKFVHGAIVPHAGYMYSGKAANYVYQAIKQGGEPDTFILLGPNHTGWGVSSAADQDWETPLGIAKADKQMIKQLNIKIDNNAQLYEHSLEVQLPFLQYYFKDSKIVPIIVSNELAVKDIVEKLKKIKSKICIIASSDFTHHGPAYGYAPFAENVKENLYKQDKQAIKYIVSKDVNGFEDFLRQTGATICGQLPIRILLQIVKGNGKLLDYYTSGDISGDYLNAVGYAAIIFV